MKLELQTLIEMGACKNQVEKFRAMFGDSVDVTVEMCQSVASEFDWEWAAKNLLPYPLYADYRAKRAKLFASLFIAAQRGEG